MAKNAKLSSRAALGYRSANKDRRKQFHIKQKQVRDSLKRDERFRRKREEEKDPQLREERRAENVPHTLDSKRTWDEAVGEDGDDMLGLAVDLEQHKKRKLDKLDKLDRGNTEDNTGDDDADSMLDFDSDDNGDDETLDDSEPVAPVVRVSSPPNPTATTSLESLDLVPESLAVRFPSLFEPRTPKILVTTSLHGTIHHHAIALTTLVPNSNYIRRTNHRFAKQWSLREIASFATHRNYTAILVFNEDQKKPCGLEIINLPKGPHFHFSLSNWVEGKKIPGHGRASMHVPELVLNGFRTPLGLLTARLLSTLFPVPELKGRQVVSITNSRDWMFVRYHRYIFRDKRGSEKTATDKEGKPILEEIRTGLQELGPSFTLKLRRVDKGIQRQSGQEWEWRGKTDRVRTKFQL